MKKKCSKFLSVITAMLMLASVIPLSASAETVIDSGQCGEDVTWELDSEGTLTVSGTGDMWGTEPENENSTAEYDEYKQQVKKIIVTEGVTGIGEGAFNNFRILESVTISEGVTFIGANAFDECINLRSIVLPESLEKIGGNVFQQTPLTTLQIPANVKSIEGPLVLYTYFEGYTVDAANPYFSVDEYGNLFNKSKTRLIHHYLDTELKEYTIPDTVTSIADSAFAYNLYLERINIPDSVKNIGEDAFAWCISLKEFNLPRKLEKIYCAHSGEMTAFALEKLTIPEDASFECGYEQPHFHNVIKTSGLIKEVIVYDIDDESFSVDVGYGFMTEPFSEEGLKKYIATDTKYIADTYAAILSYGQMPEPPEYNNDEILDKNATPDLVVNGENYYKIPGFTVRCYPGSNAEKYAKKYDFNIKYICDKHTEEILPAVLPTCTETGLTEGKKCSVCDEILVAQKTVEAKGHDYKTAVTVPTCTAKGFTTYTCSCGDSYTSDYVEAKGHSYVSFIEAESGCKTNGTEIFECECGDFYAESIPATGHKDNDDNNICDNCGVSVCNHICHKSGIMGFIWKIINFFQKLFRTNPVCECGMAHY